MTDDQAPMAKECPKDQMTQVSAKLNDREIRALADYIAGLR